MPEKINSKILGLFGGPSLFILFSLFFKPEGLNPAGVSALACTLWIAVWWISEAVPIAITSLLPIILFPLTNTLGIEETASSFGHKYIFLYLGGFTLAVAIEKWNLHKRIALNIISLIGTQVKKIILGFMVATAFLSMWISNTATAVMMLPIGIAIVLQLEDNPDTIQDENLIFGKALMLAIAFAASIGGVATLIGTPPNLVLAGVVEETYGIDITFGQWILFGFPISVLLLFIAWKYITEVAFKFNQSEFPGGKSEVMTRLKELGPMGYEEKCVAIIFSLTAITWILRSKVINPFIPGLDDTIIALIATVVLFIVPVKNKNELGIITWQDVLKIPWGILLLFGGGLALASAFTSTGLSTWIGGQLQYLNNMPLIILIVALIAAINFLTEFTSNLATTAMILPILAPIALNLNVHPYLLMVGATVAASCAFMLPVATPPNAVVFGSGYLKIADMMKVGIWMNLISIILLTLAIYYLLPVVWNIELNVYPETFK